MPTIYTLADFDQQMQYPPQREQARVSQMEDFANYVDRNWVKLEKDANLQRLKPNVHRFIRDFYVESVVSDAPIIDYPDNERSLEFIETIKPMLVQSMREVVGQMVTYGVGCFLNLKPLLPEVTDPRYWFPVRAAYDQNEGDVDVVAYPFAVEMPFVPDRIRIMILSPTLFIDRIHQMDGLTIGNLVTENETVLPGLSPVTPVRLSHGFYGTSMFVDLNDYVNELFRRESRISEALDRHVNPHLAVPEGALDVDDNDNVYIDSNGMIIPVPDDAENPQYITWDPSFSAQESAIERAESRILRSAAIAPVLVHKQDQLHIPSGAALRRLSVATVNRIRLIREKLSEGVKDVIVAQAALFSQASEVISIDRAGIRIQWPPELSAGFIDEADAIAVLLGTGALTQEQAIQLVSDVSRQDAQRLVQESPDPQSASDA